MEVLQNFYLFHYNFLALAIFFILIAIYCLISGNHKAFIVIIGCGLAMNLIIYKNTNDKSWERVFYKTDKPIKSLVYETIHKDIPLIEFKDTIKINFNASDKNHWVYQFKSQNANMELLHWCWFDDLWEKFSQLDIIAIIWGESGTKKIRGSKEIKLNSGMYENN